MRILGIVALCAALGGCASASEDITPAYVSPVAYQSYTCQQLALEAQSISTRAAALSGTQDGQRTKDQWTTAAAVVIFWPAAFFVSGDKANRRGDFANEGSNDRRRASLDCEKVRDPISRSATARLIDALSP